MNETMDTHIDVSTTDVADQASKYRRVEHAERFEKFEA
jgi:hypothetical protein